MYDGYRKIFNAQGLKSLSKRPVMPPHKLAIGDSDEKADIPLVIFTEQGRMPKAPLVPAFHELPYEKTAIKGANDTLSNDKFVTDDFDLGTPIGTI